MKKNSLAVALSVVAFFAPVAVYADELTDLKPGESQTGFIPSYYGFDQRTDLWDKKELVIRHNGVLKRLNVTKYFCVPECYYKVEYVEKIEPKQKINYYDMNELLRPNSGGKNVSDSDVEKKAKEMGVEKERLKKALADKNEMARLIREIEVKRAEQKEKEKDDQEKQGKGGGGGGSSGGGGGSAGGGGSSGGGRQLCGGGGFVSHGGVPTLYSCLNDRKYNSKTGTYEYGPKFAYPVNGKCSDGFEKSDTGSGSFSVICTVKSPKTNFGGASVGSLGGSSAGGSGAGGGASHASAGGASAQNTATGTGGTGAIGTGTGNVTGTGATGTGTGTGATGTGTGTGATGTGTTGTGATGTGTTGTGTTGTGTTGTGTGTDGSGDLGDMPSAPDGGGEPDWGGLKSDGGFGTFSPSSAFSTGGYCPQDIQLDFGQFGRHSLTLSFVCEAAEKLRYVFITLAYFTSAMMIFKTVNSMKG